MQMMEAIELKYKILLNILDQIRLSAPERLQKKYALFLDDEEKINQARSRAFIHLYLLVSFGILSFDEREYLITDGTYDGGIDGYYVNTENKTIYFIQSKFRTTEKNFESKEILMQEILQMDIDRILDGEELDENGNKYSGKILQLQRDISSIDDIGRYSYKVVIIANLKNVSSTSLRKLSGGYAVDLFNSDNCYSKLVFPIITGTYFNESDLNINIDLSNKNAGSKINYTVKTKISECDITVLFIPTFEVAKLMSKYKNSILKYNPRSYLEHDGQSIHRAISETIKQRTTNEFALFNNGITMLSDETHINEKIGQKNRAQLMVRNPQIINGGQTCFTLSRIYEEEQNNSEAIFEDKEVLLKVITLKEDSKYEERINLIDEISNATNKQVPVINADKFANESIHLQLQQLIFERYGLLYERKRGEFSDGVFNKYINTDIIVERNLFLRLYYSANGDLKKGFQKRLFQKNDIKNTILLDFEGLDKFNIAFQIFKIVFKARHRNQRANISDYAKVFIFTDLYVKDQPQIKATSLKNLVKQYEQRWTAFMDYTNEKLPVMNKMKRNRSTGLMEQVSKRKKYNYQNLKEDWEKYISAQAI